MVGRSNTWHATQKEESCATKPSDTSQYPKHIQLTPCAKVVELPNEQPEPNMALEDLGPEGAATSEQQSRSHQSNSCKQLQDDF